MTWLEFEEEWFVKIRQEYDLLAPSLVDNDWYRFALKRVQLLSPEAQDFIVNNPNIMGNWLIEAVAPYVLERAIGLDMV